MDEVEVYQVIEYTGSIESFNNLIDHLGDDSKFPYCNLDDKGNSTWKFTGTFLCCKTGYVYRPGDHYHVKVKKEISHD